MANKKISELTNINNPGLAAITPVVVNNITYKTSLQNLRQVLVDSGSHYFTGSQTINGNLIVSGSLTAQEYIISSSYINIVTENISGSTSFGNTEDDIHKFTGSVFIEGNLNLTATGSMKNLIVGFGEFNQSNPEVLHVESSGSFNIADFSGDFESYAQLNFKNKNSGNIASGDVVITADNGTEEIHYVDLGINSSTYNAGYVGYENDAYLINAGKDLYLGTIGGLEEHPSKVHIFTNNNWEDSQIVINSTKEISFNTSSVSSGFTYEFSGSLKLQNDLNVLGSVTASYFIGDGSQLTNVITDGSGFATTGSNFFYGDQKVIGNVESDFYVITQYLSAPTSSQQIIVTGDPNKDTLIGVYSGDDIELILLEVETSIWEFQKSGKIKFPDGTYQNTAFTTQSLNSLISKTGSYATTGSNTFIGNQTLTGSIYMGTGSIVLPNGTEIYDIGGPGYSGIGLGNNGFGINFGSNINDWAQFYNARLIEMLPADAFNIRLDGNETGWFFNGNGMEFPDATIQTTAYPGPIETGSFATTGSNTFIGNQTISGSIRFEGDTIDNGINFGTGNTYVGTAEGFLYLKDGGGYVQIDAQNPTNYAQIVLAADNEDFFYVNHNTTGNNLKFTTSGSLLLNEIPYDAHLATTGSNTFNGNQTINGSLIIQGVSEVLTVDGGFNSDRTFDYTSGSIFYLTGLTGNGIWNINNVPTDENKAITITFVVSQDSTPYSGSQYQINSSNVTVKWVDNSIPTGSSNNVDVIGLTAFRVGSSWNVLGGLSTFGI